MHQFIAFHKKKLVIRGSNSASEQCDQYCHLMHTYGFKVLELRAETTVSLWHQKLEA